MILRLANIGVLLLLCAGTLARTQSGSVASQQPAQQATGDLGPTPALSPGAAYREAMRPVEITHRSVGNWSEIEQASLAIAIKQAATACAARSPRDFTGESLIDLSRLCTAGLTWEPVVDATGRYLQDQESAKPHAAEAYAERINAELELRDRHSALLDGNTMLKAVPYDSITASATNELINYLELLYTSDAVELAARRQSFVVALLPTSSPVDPAATEPVANVQTPPDLYRQGLVLARLQQLDGHPDAADATVASLDKALPSTLPADDLAVIMAMRGQYAQLGKPLASIPVTSHGAPVHTVPVLSHGKISVLLLFPDWCAQGIRLAQQIPKTSFSVEGHEANMFGLLVETVPPRPLPHGSDDKASKGLTGFDPAYAAEYLKGTQTVTVAETLLERFHATDVPLLILVDSQGIVRLIDAADDTLLQPGKAVDSAVALVGKRWPSAVDPTHIPARRNNPTPR